MEKEVQVKKFSVTIEPALIGTGKDKKIETVMFVRLLNDRGNFDELQSIVPPKSRLDQEVKKLLELAKKAHKEQKKDAIK